MKIGIVCAGERELAPFLDVLKKDRKISKSMLVFHEGEIDQVRVVLVESGICKVNAAIASQILIDTFHVDLIINSGCAGSLLSKVKIMDVIISSYVTYHDFLPSRIMEYSVPEQGKVQASTKLIHLAEQALDNLEVTNYFVAPIASGDSFVTDSTMRDNIYEATGAYAVDMESASIGHIAKLNSIPFLSLRTISDFSDGEEDFEVIAAYKSSQLVKEIIQLL